MVTCTRGCNFWEECGDQTRQLVKQGQSDLVASHTLKWLSNIAVRAKKLVSVPNLICLGKLKCYSKSTEE